MSRTVFILDELRVALAAQTPEQGQELLELGVPAEIVWFVGAAKIQPSDGLYEPDPGGEPAWIVPCVDRSATCDLLAFTSDAPERCWLRLGVAAYVGGDALGDAVMDEPVRIFKDALSWLRAAAPADGLVVIDHDIARRELIYHNLIAEDIEHGIELERRLIIPARHPHIYVQRIAA